MRRARTIWPRGPGWALPTGLAPLDGLLQGGLPRGCLVEIAGAGQMTAAVAALAAATRQGHIAALVDPAGALDARTAEEMGAELRRVLWVTPVNPPDMPRRSAGDADWRAPTW